MTLPSWNPLWAGPDHRGEGLASDELNAGDSAQPDHRSYQPGEQTSEAYPGPLEGR